MGREECVLSLDQNKLLILLITLANNVRLRVSVYVYWTLAFYYLAFDYLINWVSATFSFCVCSFPDKWTRLHVIRVEDIQ
jgi:hypothetical protein